MLDCHAPERQKTVAAHAAAFAWAPAEPGSTREFGHQWTSGRLLANTRPEQGSADYAPPVNRHSSANRSTCAPLRGKCGRETRRAQASCACRIDPGQRWQGHAPAGLAGAGATTERGTAAHALKGAAGNVGAVGLHRVAGSLEADAKQGMPAGGRESLASLEALWASTRDALKPWA